MDALTAEKTAIAPVTARYIKLGPGNRWAERCLSQGELPLLYINVPHEPCVARDWAEVAQILERAGTNPRKVPAAVREIRDFYTLRRDCLWIAIAHKRLHWAFADPEVQWQGGDGKQCAPRVRKTIGSWRSTDIRGTPLSVDRISTRLTKVAGYWGTICAIHEIDRLIRLINAVEDPQVARARAVRSEMRSLACELIRSLHQDDFELLLDLILTRGGQIRLSAVGGKQADTDIVLENPFSTKRTFVQVKSRATQKVLDESVSTLAASGLCDRIIFACHTPIGTLSDGGRADLQIWTGDHLAELTIKHGLIDWLIERVQ